ncbi:MULTISPECIES: cell wall metabolism sensor histidine kinase WalK [Sporolactobacillus]|uniref:histidine kinase n=2 Tax=Sporolactobacillus TaxID=2077 RepID=A0A0U1QNJ9_9BACL|nr:MULTISPECIES: cell wall metabolism sensor histidine kinase WalK [Sporolactobacillus]KLI02383.1 histidine kinase [Sporolactobacillus inulinus CASD]QAA23886.1 cell wall metabolism sensor histidine kinase WalK [Sporolactobacillus terrae]QAA26857.1 cell wall metabolism sensor histidine kinase WalK [Sporolactobacillus terrae]UAK15916.1 cell wall metabolism sensor histidine kinase WalK [Sporolactobacillus terrae]BBO00424.1 PAS domain-containing sensor histidine kinase [Sporolactobacillus terrae]
MNKVGFFKSIQFKVVLIYTLLILLAMQLIGVYFADRVKTITLDSFENSLESQSQLIAWNVGEAIRQAQESNVEDPNHVADQIQNQLLEIDANIREIEVIDDNMVIVAADEKHRDAVGKRTTNQLVVQNLSSTSTNKFRRADRSSGERIDIVTTPIMVDNHRYGMLYVEKSFENVYEQLQQINQILATATIFALLVTAILGFFLARTITRPLVQMQRQVMAVSQGNFTRKVQMTEPDEIGKLATSFNNMTLKLREANATTESERRKLKSVLTFMTDGVIATDRKGNVVLMNNRSEQLLNVYRHDVTGNSILDLLKIRKDYKIMDLYNMENSIVLDFSTDDETILLRANFSVVKKDSGLANGLIAVIHDVTEQEQVDMERREFVANVSHELRTPLTTMKSYLEALQDGAVEDPALASKFLGVTQRETERMIRLVNDLLQLSRLDSKDYKIHLERTDYITFCQSIMDRFEMSKKQNIEFVRQFPKGSFYVLIDRDKLTQVIDNIISNAIKYSPEGGIITFAIRRRGNKIRSMISDQGVGIPKENLPKIFNRFYRVDRARSRKLGGTGLGLAIAKEMVEAQGGEIWAESDWNRGTTIHFILPLDRRDS